MAVRRAKYKARSLERNASAPFLTTTTTNASAAEKEISKKDPITATIQMGHEFKKTTFYKPTYCQHCSDMLWGLMNQGYQCAVCNYVSHEKCMPYIVVNCVHLNVDNIKEPMNHVWVGPKVSQRKKKHCNVCRRRIHNKAYYCQVCRTYAHGACVSEALNNCKKCSMYSSLSQAVFRHHWVEGNLPMSAKCEVCGKGCFSDQCLTGFKCGWCGINVHSACLDTYLLNAKHEKCTFRDVQYMVLPPLAVSMHLMSCDQLADEVVEEADAEQLFSPDEDDDGDKDSKSDSKAESKGRAALIIDGSTGQQSYSKWRRRTLHPTHIPKHMCTEELLRISLRKFGINECPDDYSISEVLADGSNRELKSNEKPYNLNQSYRGPLKLYIRKREAVRPTQTMRIFNSKLTSSTALVLVDILETTSADEVITLALEEFDLKGEDPSKYCLYETNQSQGVRERIVPATEKPWKNIKKLSEDTLKVGNLLRYYLHPKEELLISFCITKLSRDALENVDSFMSYLKRIIDSDSTGECDELSIIDDITVGALLPDDSTIFIDIKKVTSAEALYRILSDNNVKVKVLPTVHPNVLTQQQEPVLIFINAKSGGNQGKELLCGFKRHLNPYQVFDLMDGGPLPGLYIFRNIESFRILVGGGDGTVGWVLSGLDKMRDYLNMESPPCAVLPLGTGNDLARALKWGGGYTNEKVMNLLASIEDANCMQLDRWQVEFEDGKDSKTIIMNNYLGIGLDAEIALDFHTAREDNPEKFNSRFHNKSVYLQLGMQKTFTRETTQDLDAITKLYVNDNMFIIPNNLKGIVMLNISSWGAGSEPWGSHRDDDFVTPSCSDNLLEVFGLSGPMHLGQIKGGIKNGIRLAQGHKIKIVILKPLPVQVDGEAWLQGPNTTITITPLHYQATMLVKSQSALSKGSSHHEVKSMLSKQKVVGADMSQFSQRRGRPDDYKRGVSSHTFYVKPDDEAN